MTQQHSRPSAGASRTKPRTAHGSGGAESAVPANAAHETVPHDMHSRVHVSD